MGIHWSHKKGALIEPPTCTSHEGPKNGGDSTIALNGPERPDLAVALAISEHTNRSGQQAQ
eukprot:CAMPEP_0183548906 /NCGR_PEP_ID=MMETSP0371-20130417/61617_1 /TAXON_ID=268820 /ORGANISM="Peridinium aciculiferum, Strain PAER-2" /LENGTH=60 /DNA_ID=CAMNT_0025752441 /DNA_START=69 /DNA_END=251 /DNA_ORIENTATION=-